jgi:hypothetical protein
MKWCIITTKYKNPGDEFIRVGIENMIREVDSEAIIELVDKEAEDMFALHNFDKCILAGMPVFWSFHSNDFWNIKWWKPLIEYYSVDKNKFMVLGAGSFQNWENVTDGVNTYEYINQTNTISNQSWKITLRDNIPNVLANTSFDVLPCPAIFSTKNYEKTGDIKLCNLMPIGGHYTDFNVNQSRIWGSKVRDITKILQDNDFTFIAHNKQEEQFAQYMNWKNIIAYDGNPESLLQYYKNCVKYFGNRVHGAIVSRGVNADVLSCGFDSRQEAVKLTGATCLLPSQLGLTELEKWTTRNLNQPEFKFDDEYERQKNIIKGFKEI